MNYEETEELLQALDQIARKAVKKVLTERGIVLFSGGIDSSILASLVAKFAKHCEYWRLYTLGLEGSADILQSKLEISAELSFSKMGRIVRVVDQEKIVNAGKKVNELVRCSRLSQFEDCIAFYLLCDELSSELRETTLFTANGPDELFCGYDRFRRIVDASGYTAAEEEIIIAIQTARQLQQQVKTISSYFGTTTIIEPFFESEFVNFTLDKIPIQSKIQRGNDLLRKRIWRAYGRYLGLPENIVSKPKKAMQYSMGIHKAIISSIKRGEIDFKLSSSLEVPRTSDLQ